MVVRSAVHLLVLLLAEINHRRLVRPKAVGGAFLNRSEPLQRLLDEPQGGFLSRHFVTQLSRIPVSGLLRATGNALRRWSSHTPRHRATSTGKSPRPTHLLTLHISGEQRPEPLPPVPHGLVADVDPALGQQIVDVTQAQRKADVRHHHQTDYLR